MRVLKALTALVVAVAAFMAATATAFAAGTGGLEVTPIPAFDAHGSQITAFHLTPSNGKAKGQFELRNLNSTPTTARLYGATVTQGTTADSYAVGDAKSGAWLGLGDQTVTLAPKQTRLVTFNVTTSKTHTLGAVVVEQTHGTIVERAATMVTIEGTKGLTAAGIAVGIACVAAGLALLVGLGHGLRLMKSRKPAVS